jgi:hypothetical protein
LGGLDGGGGLDTSAVGNVHDIHTGEGVHGAELVGASRLVADGEVERADLVVAVLAAAGRDVVQSRVVVEPGADRAADIGVDAVGGHERQFAESLLVNKFVVSRKADDLPIRSLNDGGALAHGSILPFGRDTTTHGGLLLSTNTDVKVVPGVVADVVGTARGVDLEEVDSAAVGGDTLAKVVAVGLHGPVGDAVNVDEAAKHTNRRGEGVVGSDGDAGGSNGRSQRESGSNLGQHCEARRYQILCKEGIKRCRERGSLKR